ncbi:protein POLR1D-like [Rhinolophus sinicus]|uniref:protein POLR1D-like n=1 Tax=Rhinolophus sinicus TaxID=89399 RepID=UPI003D7BF711
MEEDQELERKAIDELLKEAKRGKTRAETMGAMGWMRCPLAGTNKRFLINTIKNTLPSHKEQDPEQKEGDKEPEESQNQKEENRKKHRAHPYKHSFRARGTARHSPPREQSSQDKYKKQSNKRSGRTESEHDCPQPRVLLFLGLGLCRKGYQGQTLSWQSKHLRVIFL